MNLIKSTGTFSFFVIISRLLGYIRDVLIAIYLGSGPIADAFFVAFRIPNTFRRLFAEGSFNAAFVPSYSSELLRGKAKAKNFANDTFNFLMLGLLVLVITIEILQSVVDFFDYNNPNHKFKIIVDDFYDYVMNTNQRFDAILLQLDFPGVSSNAKYCLESNKRLYTKEFLSRIKDILNDEGVFVTEGLGKENDDLKDSHITKLFQELKFDPIEMWDRPFLPMDSIDHILWRCVNGPI